MIFLSIIIPIRNEEKYIESTLDVLVNQDYPPDRFEIIVVDGMSDDNTRIIVENFINEHSINNIKLLNNPEILSSRARNIGIKVAMGKLIAVIDGHVHIPDNQLFKNMEHLMRNHNALCLARPAPLDVPGLKIGKAYWIAMARKSWLGHSKNSFIYSDFEGFVNPMSSGFAYDRSVFEKVGYFDESFDAAEDVEFHFRLKKNGIMAYTSPVLLIYYFPRRTLKELFYQQVRYGIGRARFVKKHPAGFTKETPIPSLIFIYLLSFPFILFLFHRFKLLASIYFIGLLTYWAILLLTGFMQGNKGEKIAASIYIAAAISTTHLGLGWGFIKKVLAK
jgi:succinoglycan biosynthesis protein ExoA